MLNFAELMDKREELNPLLKPYIVTNKLGVMLHHPIIQEIGYTPQLNALINARFEVKTQALKKAMRERDYLHVMLLHERPYRLMAFDKVQVAMTDKDYWQTLRYVYVDTENMAQNYEQWHVFLFNTRKKSSHLFMTTAERKELKSMNDLITVYRGTDSDNTDGFSWTTNKDVAIWFSRRFKSRGNHQESRVLTGAIYKPNVLAYITSRKEYEIVCDPKNVTVLTVEQDY